MAKDRNNPGGDSDYARVKKEEQTRRNRRRSRQLIGFALTILIVVGAVSIVRSGINMANKLMDQTEEMEDFGRRIEPLVWYDLLPFESLDKADMNRLQGACIWGLLDQRKESGEPFEQNELGDTLVPAALVDRFGADLFGPDFKFPPVEGDQFYDERQEMAYPFDAENQVFYIPPTSLNIDYIPTVLEIKRESGGVRRVVVGYVSTRGSDDRIVDTPDMNNPERYMDFLFRRDGNEYYLFALETNTSYIDKSSSTAAAEPDSSMSEQENVVVSSSASDTASSAESALPDNELPVEEVSSQSDMQDSSSSYDSSVSSSVSSKKK